MKWDPPYNYRLISKNMPPFTMCSNNTELIVLESSTYFLLQHMNLHIVLTFHSYISHKVILFLRDSLLLQKNYYFRNDGLLRQEVEVHNEVKKTYKKM